MSFKKTACLMALLGMTSAAGEEDDIDHEHMGGKTSVKMNITLFDDAKKE